MFTFRQILQTVVDGKAKKLKVFQLSCIGAGQTAEERAESDASVDLKGDCTTRDDGEVVHD